MGYFLDHAVCYLCYRTRVFVAKESEMQEKELKLMELQEMYETRLLAMKVTFSM